MNNIPGAGMSFLADQSRKTPSNIPAPGPLSVVNSSIRNGKIILQNRGTYLEHTTEVPGIYRVEVYKRFRGRKVGWIFCSPIYVD